MPAARRPTHPVASMRPRQHHTHLLSPCSGTAAGSWPLPDHAALPASMAGVERQAVDPRRRTAASMQENGQRASRVTSRSRQSLRAGPSRRRSDQVRANDDAGCAAVRRYGRGVGMERLGAGRPSPWRRPAPEASPAGVDGHCGEEQHEVRGRHLGCVTLKKNGRRQPAVTARHRPGRLATSQVPMASPARHLIAWGSLPAAAGGGSPMARLQRLAYLLEV
jgi:hypothetical protein